MRKKETSKKQGNSWTRTPIRKLKKGVTIKEVSPTKRLADQELIFRALWESLLQKDIPSFQRVLALHIEAMNKLHLSKKSRLSRRTLYRVITPGENPTLKSLSQVLSALYGA